MNMNLSVHHSGAYSLFFGTLANEKRLAIMNVLRKKPLCVSEICAKTGFEQTLVSHHLKMLEYHGMVFVKREGKYKYFSLNEKTIHPLLDLIDAHMRQYCCKIMEGIR
jgi:ArsR family transcriptional regulator